MTIFSVHSPDFPYIFGVFRLFSVFLTLPLLCHSSYTSTLSLSGCRFHARMRSCARKAAKGTVRTQKQQPFVLLEIGRIAAAISAVPPNLPHFFVRPLFRVPMKRYPCNVGLRLAYLQILRSACSSEVFFPTDIRAGLPPPPALCAVCLYYFSSSSLFVFYKIAYPFRSVKKIFTNGTGEL